MLKKVATTPDLLINAFDHQQAKEKGREHFESWNCNVVDEFKGKFPEEIKNILKSRSLGFACLLENVISDFNIASAIRNANNFCVNEVFYVGDKKYDKRGACGVFNYTDVNWLSTLDEVIKLKEKYAFVAIDNQSGSVPLNNYNWKKFNKPICCVFGSESVGITPTMSSLCEEMVHIKSMGSVRSINIASAAGIVFYDITNKLLT